MAFNMQRRKSSWFGPQFSLQSFGLNNITSTLSARSSASDLRRDSKTQESKSRQQSAHKLSVCEPLFHDCYLSTDEEKMPLETETKAQTWGFSFDDMDLAPDETLEDLGFALEDEDSSIVATYISIFNVGKPKVIDISPTASIREQSSPKLLRTDRRIADSTSIYWRMPSYESSSRSSSTFSGRTDRTESFDSRSSVSESSPKTPDLVGSFPLPDLESTKQNTIPERARTLRRQSRTLSVSLSKAFLGRLKETSPPPPLPVESMSSSRALPNGIPKIKIASDTLPQRTPVPRRRKDLAGESWYDR